MKLITVIAFFYCTAAYGQRKPHFIDDRVVTRGDSLELLYTKTGVLKVVTDTLPLYSTREETTDWRDMQLVTWFYDSSTIVKKITFRNGEEGYCSFYFDGPFLRKARLLKRGQSINLQCYFTNEDNSLPVSELEQKMAEHPEEREWYGLLKTGKDFLERFKLRLSNKTPDNPPIAAGHDKWLPE